MKNIGMRITAVMVVAIIITMGVATSLGVLAIRSIGSNDSDQMLLLLGESGRNELEDYFWSVAQAVEIEAAYAESDLEYRGLEGLPAHVEWARGIFSRLAGKTTGVLTYYYRIDPSVSDTEKGFWYVNLDGKGFTEHEVTDITLYDTDDTSALVWFTVPKYEGKPVWLPPYITDNLDVRVISYNVPIYWHDTFVGVLGIEIDYATMASVVDRISFNNSGYAFIEDSDGRLVYHPHMDVPAMEVLPDTPEGLDSDETFREYTYDGVTKRAVEVELSNGMRLIVSVPVRELNARWQGWVNQIVSISAVLLVSAILMFVYILHIIQKQKETGEAAAKQEKKQEAPSVDAGKPVERTRPVGQSEHRIVEGPVNRVSHDNLTGVMGRDGYDVIMSSLDPEGVCLVLVDTDNFRDINDRYGHETGDRILLKIARALKRNFRQSDSICRMGGDEFVVIMQCGDSDLHLLVTTAVDEVNRELSDTSDGLPPASVSAGIADGSLASDPVTLFEYADRAMYECKREGKSGYRFYTPEG